MIMPTFEIPDGPTAIEAPRAGDPKTPQPAVGSAVYSVTNTASESVVGRLGVKVAGSSKVEWFTIDGDRERTFDPGETQTVTIRVSFPPDVPAGDYPFRLRAVAVNDPDNDHAEGPMTTAKLGAGHAIVGTKSWLWLWILLGVLALLVIAGVLYLLLSSGKSEPAAQGVIEAVPADACKPGFVWREAAAADHVCVPPDSRDRARVENRLADLRRAPGGGAYGPNTCKVGFVWREAFAGDVVCVEPEIRSLVAQENAQGAGRRL
jgi:hypothetical protein